MDRVNSGLGFVDSEPGSQRLQASRFQDARSRGPCIHVPGVSERSPLASRLHRAASGGALIVMAGEPLSASPWWRWTVRGTALDWFGPAQASAVPADQPDILLDLHGTEDAQPLRTWRVVDAYGRPVLRASAATGTRRDRPLVSSLYLVESSGEGAGWFTLAEAHVSARHRSRGLLDALGRAVVWLVAAAIRQQHTSAPPSHPAPFQPLSPTPAVAIATRLSRARAVVRDHLASDVWAIGMTAEPIENFLSSRTVSASSWFEIPCNEGFVADPFPWPGRAGAILYERYSNKAGRASIEALVPDAGGQPQTVPLQLDVSTHLSYPFTYAEPGLVLCLPEMLWERKQLIYRLEPDAPPAVLAEVAKDVAMADPTLFRHGGLYWIAYNDADLGLHENLCLRYATRLEGPWIPHPLNPVKMDVRSSRPGGAPFTVGGTLFRPAQDCSRSYGCALVINKIVTCTPHEYQEEFVARLTPDPQGRYPDGFHTLSVTPNGILFDGKRIIFNRAIMRQRIQRQLRTTWRRLFGGA
jgi:hypothetical protein